MAVHQEESLALSEDIRALYVEEIGDSCQLEIHNILQVLQDVPLVAQSHPTVPHGPQSERPNRMGEMKV